MAKMGELHFAAKVQTCSRITTNKRGQRSAIQVVALQLRVAKTHQLRQKRVRADKTIECITEQILIGNIKRMEPIDCRLKCCVDTPVIFDRRHCHQQTRDLFDLIACHHAKGVQHGAGVVQKIRIRRRCNRLAEPGLERFTDRFGIVTEIKHECAVFPIGDSIQTRQRLHRVKTGQYFVHIHCVQQRLIETRLVLLGDDKDVANLIETFCGLTVGKTVELGFGHVNAVVVYGSREGNVYCHITVPVIGQILVEVALIANRVKP